MMGWWVTSTLRNVLGSSDTLYFSAGTRLTWQLTHCVLVRTGRTLDALLLLPAVECPQSTAHWEGRHRWVLPVAPIDVPHYDRAASPWHRQLVKLHTYHTFPLLGLAQCCKHQRPLELWTVSEPPRTPSQRTGCRTAVCWWTSWASAWRSAASASSSPEHIPYYTSLRQKFCQFLQISILYDMNSYLKDLYRIYCICR